MQFKIVRKYKEKSSVCGKFYVEDEGNEKFKCYSLENLDEGAESGKDLRIPEGKYKLKWFESPKFNATLRKITENEKDLCICVYNDSVPETRRILIHWGNTDKDTEGCILLGYQFRQGDNAIGNSRAVFKDLYNLIRDEDIEKIELEVINDY